MGADGLHQNQPLALLSYLAIDGPKTRRHLGTVFWPEAKDRSNNLSSSLTRIRTSLPDAIAIDGKTLTCTVATDVSELLAAVDRQDSAAVLKLYQGDFFASADLRSMGLELEEWVFSTREYLARTTANSLLAAAERSRSARRADAATLAGHAFRIGAAFWVTAEPWQRCYDLLASEQAAVLAEKVKTGAQTQGVVLEIARSAAPRISAQSRPPTGLLGRQDELAALHDFVDEASDDWLAIVGLGGVGKTALAREMLRQLDESHSPHTTQLISLADVRRADQLPDAIAAMLHLSGASTDDLVAGLRRRCWPGKPMVLVLDNLEQFDDYATVAHELTTIEGLTLIVTSRVASGHPRERTLRLQGLATSGAGPALFTATALPICPTIEEQPQLVERVCQMVDGLPLAIELCAGWLRTVPIDVLVNSLQESTELVESAPRAALESVASILDRSWDLLDPDDARVLGHLSLFDGSFGYREATRVADTTLTILTRLIDSSLVERQDDRLVLHPLVRSHARSRQATRSELTEAVERRFVAHYREVIVDAARHMRGPDAGRIAPELATSFPNVQVAWRLAQVHADWKALVAMVDGIDLHLKSQSRQFLAAQIFEDALDTLDADCSQPSPDPEARAAFVAIGWRYAITRRVQGGADDAHRIVERSLTVCDPDDRLGQMALSYTQGHLAVFDGDYHRAAEHFDHATSLDDGSVDERFVAEVDAGRALVALSLGHNDEGRRLLRSVLDTGRRLGNPVTITSAYYFLGTLELDDDPAQAVVLLEEGRLVAEQASMTHMARKYATITGRCHVKLGDPDRALAVFEEALRDTENEAQVVREPWVRVSNQMGMAMAHAATGDTAGATPWFEAALRAQVELEDWVLLLETLLEICRLRIDQAEAPNWTRLLAVVANHPAAIFGWQEEVGELLAQFGQQTLDDLAGDYRTNERIDVLAESAIALLHA